MIRRAVFGATVPLLALAGCPALAGQGENPALQAAMDRAEAVDASGHPLEAEAAWRTVLSLEDRHGTSDPVVRARAYSRIADAMYYRGHPELGQVEMERAVAVLERAGLGETDMMSETLTNLGVFLSAQGHADRDVAMQQRALAIRARLYGADDNRLAANYFNLGNALYERGRLERAADNIERGAAMRLATTAPEDPDLFITLASAAGIVSAAGRPEKAIDFAQQAVDLVNRYHPGHPYTGFVRGVLGKALVNGGRASEAVPVTRQAIDELAQSMGRTSRLTAEARSALAKAQAKLGHFEEAKALTLASLGQNDGSTLPEQVRDYFAAANYAAEAGEDEEALAIARDGLAMARERLPADHQVLAQMAMVSAMASERLGHDRDALPLYREARRVLAEQAEPDPRLLMHADVYLGGAEIRAGQVEAGFARVARAAEALVPQMYAAAEAPDLGAMDNSFYDVFARAAQAAVDAGRTADAFRYFQLASYNSVARASGQVALRNAAGQGSEAADLVRALQDRQRDLRALNVQLTSLLAAGKSDAAAEVRRAMSDASAAIRRTRDQLQRVAPGFEQLNAQRPLALAEVQAQLGRGDAVFLALPSRLRTTLMLITPDEAQSATSPSGRAAMRAHVAAIRHSIDDALLSDQDHLPPFDLAASHALYEALFPKRFRDLEAHVKHLYVDAADALAQVPFSILVTRKPDSGATQDLRRVHWLIREMSVEVPASLAAVGKPSAAIDRYPTFAGIGAPHLARAPAERGAAEGPSRNGKVDLDALRDLPPLPGAAEELARMHAAFPGARARLLTGDDAREGLVRQMDLAGYSVLAFATHGLIAGELYGLAEPALVLTPPEKASRDDDGLLTASEIADLDISARFVVLSACNTATGITQAAPAYTGLAHAFLYAGAKSLLLSHWQVRDDAAARLSVATVRGSARGKPPAEALRAAMLGLMDDARVPGSDHPAVWAPFILVSR
ncbi:hypothetical protein LK12_03235 [Novosphingobium malaysiense]|uniref:CHAT domain-containing protein n=1 Tax=Novosphingobium malaysiense TaxID=1348853 RepID=A0A0B1ZVZ9_9SPHN|nr:hypothetical protein LK12_03235 [Novosphingobium malaysiense]